MHVAKIYQFPKKVRTNTTDEVTECRPHTENEPGDSLSVRSDIWISTLIIGLLLSVLAGCCYVQYFKQFVTPAELRHGEYSIALGMVGMLISGLGILGTIYLSIWLAISDCQFVRWISRE